MVKTIESILSEQVNEEETMEQFIRNSEVDLGLDPADIFNMDIEGLTQYIEWLDHLWEK